MPRALVIGGGVAGPAAAMFLAADGGRFEIFEAAANPDDYAGLPQRATNGLTVLDALGLREHLLLRRPSGSAHDHVEQHGQATRVSAEWPCR